MKFLGAAIMVKNEQDRIVRTVSTCVKVIEHLVVLDTGSTDNTINNIKNYCNKINLPLKLVESPFENFSKSRNVLMRACDGVCEFMLLLDANDEIKNPNSILGFLKNMEDKKEFVMFTCKYHWINMSQRKGNDANYDKPGIIRTGVGLEYKYPTHEYLVIPKGKSEHPGLLQTDYEIFQDRLKDKSSKPRFKHDVEILRKFIAEEGEQLRAYRFLCQSHSALEDWENLYNDSAKFVVFVETKCNKNKFDIQIYYAYLYFAQSSYHMKKSHEHYAKYFLKAYNHSCLLVGRAEPIYELSVAHFCDGRYEKALEWIEKCCKIPTPSPDKLRYVPEINMSVYERIRWYLYSELLLLNGEYDKYIEINKMLKEKKLYSHKNDIINKKIKLEYVKKEVLEKLKKKGIDLVKLQENMKTKNEYSEMLEKHIQQQIKSNKQRKTHMELIENNNGSELVILISFRDRDEQLEKLFNYLEGYFKFLKLKYHIFVLYQVDDGDFNKGILYNTGVKEVIKIMKNKGVDKYHFCFHDVDIYPVKGTNYFRPEENLVEHLYGYQFCLGGVFTMLPETFMSVNGFSNRYFGWGFEDNDFMRRFLKKDIEVSRLYFYPRFNGECFREMDEDKEAPGKKMLLPQTKVNQYIFEENKAYQVDGINQIRYDIGDDVSVMENEKYTIIGINVENICKKYIKVI